MSTARVRAKKQKISNNNGGETAAQYLYIFKIFTLNPLHYDNFLISLPSQT